MGKRWTGSLKGELTLRFPISVFSTQLVHQLSEGGPRVCLGSLEVTSAGAIYGIHRDYIYIYIYIVGLI